MPGNDAITVLHVDDDRGFLEASIPLLEREDEAITVVTAEDPETALSVLAEDSMDCVVSDYRCPTTTGSRSSRPSASATATSPRESRAASSLRLDEQSLVGGGFEKGKG